MEILKNAEYLQTRLGGTIYVWSPGGNKPPADRSRSCVISSHGRHAPGPSKYPAPEHATLVYYTPHGYTLDRTDVIELAKGNTPHFAKVGPGQGMNDYTLTKFQEEEKESYAFIQHGMHRAAQAESARRRYMIKPHDVKAMKRHGTEAMEELARRLKESLEKLQDPRHDVVTVRNRDRRFFSPPTLFEVVYRLEKAGFHYGEIHCGFCKAYADQKSEGWIPTKRNV